MWNLPKIELIWTICEFVGAKSFAKPPPNSTLNRFQCAVRIKNKINVCYLKIVWIAFIKTYILKNNNLWRNLWMCPNFRAKKKTTTPEIFISASVRHHRKIGNFTFSPHKKNILHSNNNKKKRFQETRLAVNTFNCYLLWNKPTNTIRIKTKYQPTFELPSKKKKKIFVYFTFKHLHCICLKGVPLNLSLMNVRRVSIFCSLFDEAFRKYSSCKICYTENGNWKTS